MTTGAASLLETLPNPAALRALPEAALGQVATELREFLIDSVARSGGHLAAGLGVVELTIALHYVFDTPRDALVWDVGHQGYPHKALTGRRDRMHTLRKRGGLSGFLRRDESPYDAFGAGHSSTSISAAVGMAVASEASATPCKTVAIIGDGALTAGLAYEALQQAGARPELDLLVVVNDNGMSISPNVGSLSRSLSGHADGQRTAADRDAGHLFRELGFSYVGPCDGHDLDALVATLREMRDMPGPRVLHVRTRKGHGYAPAEADPVKYHGVTPFDPAEGIVPSPARGLPAYTDVFGDWLCETAARDPRLMAITPAMREGSGLVRFADRFPDRYFDVGIAEQHSIAFAAGLACRGARPGRRDLLDVPAARLRPAGPRRRAAETAGAVRDRPRGTGRPRRRHAQRRVRPELPALRAGHGRDDAERRQRAARHAAHGPRAPGPGGRALSALRNSGPARPARAPVAAARHGGPAPDRLRPGGDAGVRHAARPGARARRTNSTPRSSTCASSSRSTRRWCSRWHAGTTCW